MNPLSLKRDLSKKLSQKDQVNKRNRLKILVIIKIKKNSQKKRKKPKLRNLIDLMVLWMKNRLFG
jgi:hypothetical protein